MGDKLGRLVPDSGTPIYIGPLAVTVADVLAGEAVGHASVHAEGGSGSSLNYTAVEPGLDGNLIGILSDVQPNTNELTVSVDGTLITLHLQTDSEGNVLSLFNNVNGAIAASPEASALITGGANGGDPYDIGDVYLLGGSNEILVEQGLPSGSVIWDAQEFFPQAWDASTLLVARLGASRVQIFYDGNPDSADGDDTSQEGVAIATTDVVFNTSRRLRLTADSDLVVEAVGGEAGAVPTQGEMLFYAEIIAPS